VSDRILMQGNDAIARGLVAAAARSPPPILGRPPRRSSPPIDAAGKSPARRCTSNGGERKGRARDRLHGGHRWLAAAVSMKPVGLNVAPIRC